MRLAHRLRGYDKRTDELAFECDIPPNLVTHLKRVVSAYPDDPDLAGLYALNEEQAQRIALALERPLDLKRLTFVLDASADWEDIQALKRRLRVSA